jgi:nucleoid-associated protein YgaU
MRRLGVALRALVGIVGLVALVAGTPILLYVLVGDPRPPEGFSWDAPMSVTTDMLIGLVGIICAIVWIQFVICVGAAIVDEWRWNRDRRILAAPVAPLGTAGWQRRLARTLIGGIAAGLLTAPVAATATTAAAPPAATATVQPHTVDHHRHADDGRHVEDLKDLRLATVTTDEPNLWTIAENHLGTGERWHEIKQLNDGRTMADGATFHSAKQLQLGWKLLMPADATNLPLASATTSEQTTPADYTVQPGDSLSAIADRIWGDGNRWPELYQANRELIGGDPNVIHAGQTLAIPGANADTERHDDHREAGPRSGGPAAPARHTTFRSQRSPQDRRAGARAHPPSEGV